MHLNRSSMAENRWEVPSNAAIDWAIDDRGSTCVTSLSFPFWLDVLAGKEGFSFYTYCPVREEVGKLELLRIMNDCNHRMPMVHFSASKCGRRPEAHYSLHKPDDLHRRDFLFAMRRFSDILLSAVKAEDNFMTVLYCDAEEVSPRENITQIGH